MAATSSNSTNLRMYVNDTVALERHIEDALARQLEDDRVKALPEVEEFLQRIHTILHAHVLTMENHSAAIGGEFGAGVKEVVSSFAGVLAGLYDKVRKHPVSRLLRDDYTALALGCTAYSMLHTTGLAVRELPIANVALRHLNELTPLIVELSRLIPKVVVTELAEDDPDIDRTAAELGSENTAKAWRPSK
jgi:hypothetical protein